jgi:hypothetical protein
LVPIYGVCRRTKDTHFTGGFSKWGLNLIQIRLDIVELNSKSRDIIGIENMYNLKIIILDGVLILEH